MTTNILERNGTGAPAAGEALYTPDDLAETLAVPRRMLGKWVLQKRIPVIKVGRLNRFSREQVLKFFPNIHFPKKQFILEPYKISLATIQHQKCRQETHKLIHEGELIPEPCFICGEKKTHAHHNDYSDPVNVTWLCPRHHYEIHREMKIQRAAA